jgi:hypothetical protein
MKAEGLAICARWLVKKFIANHSPIMRLEIEGI